MYPYTYDCSTYLPSIDRACLNQLVARNIICVLFMYYVLELPTSALDVCVGRYEQYWYTRMLQNNLFYILNGYTGIFFNINCVTLCI